MQAAQRVFKDSILDAEGQFMSPVKTIWKHEKRVLSLNTEKESIRRKKKASFRLLNCIQIKKKPSSNFDVKLQERRNNLLKT